MEKKLTKKVVIHIIAFHPDGVSTAYLYNDIVKGFIDNNIDVEIISTTPHFNYDKKNNVFTKKFFGLYYESSFYGKKVYHVLQKKYKNTFLRIIGFLFWHVISFLIMIFKIKKFDFILSPSPPLSLGVINILVAKIKKAKTIYNIQEIYPELLIKQGKLSNSIIINILNHIEKFVYNNSDYLTTIDKVFYDQIISKINVPEKLIIIPNFVDDSKYYPIENQSLKTEYLNIDNSNLKVMYAGNIGIAQDWETLTELAKNTIDLKVTYFVIGGGVRFNDLKKTIKDNNISNIRLLPYQERDKIVEFINYADLHFIFMNNKIDEFGLPSKIYTIMACKKPLLISSSLNSPLSKTLKNINCSLNVDNILPVEKRISKIREYIVEILKNKIDLNELGVSGYNHAKKNYFKNKIIDKYINLLR